MFSELTSTHDEKSKRKPIKDSDLGQTNGYIKVCIIFRVMTDYLTNLHAHAVHQFTYSQLGERIMKDGI